MSQGLSQRKVGVGFAATEIGSECESPIYDRRTENRLQAELPRRQKTQALQLLALVAAILYAYLIYVGMSLELLALFKAVPVLLLMLMVLVVGDRRPYGMRVAGALAACMLGNICLELEPLPSLHGMPLFPLGLGFFLVGHATYLFAFTANPLRLTLRTTLPPALAVAILYALLRPHVPPSLFAPVLVYAMVMGLEIAVALSREPEGHAALYSWRCATAGTVLFTAASTILGFDRFTGALPHGKLGAMSCYYVAQFLLAMSARGSQQRQLTRTLGSVENFTKYQSFRTFDTD